MHSLAVHASAHKHLYKPWTSGISTVSSANRLLLCTEQPHTAANLEISACAWGQTLLAYLVHWQTTIRSRLLRRASLEADVQPYTTARHSDNERGTSTPLRNRSRFERSDSIVQRSERSARVHRVPSSIPTHCYVEPDTRQAARTHVPLSHQAVYM